MNGTDCGMVNLSDDKSEAELQTATAGGMAAAASENSTAVHMV